MNLLDLVYLDPKNIEIDPSGIREDLGDIAGLAATIAEQGLLQPLGVVQTSSGGYRLIYGHRRLAAIIQLGWDKVPCILQDTEALNLLIQQLIENVQRKELNGIEQAQAYAQLRTQLSETKGSLSESELDEMVGKTVAHSGRTVRRYLGLLELPAEIQQLIRQGELGVTRAQHLRRVTPLAKQLELARLAAQRGMSAADVSRLASYLAASPNLTVEEALTLEQTMPTPQRPAPPEGQITYERLGKTSRAAVAKEPGESDADFWPEDKLAPEDCPFQPGETLENQPRNKARTFRLRSLQQMVEEVSRLERAQAEGDVATWVQQDAEAALKLRLMVRQLESLARGLRQVIQDQGWEEPKS